MILGIDKLHQMVKESKLVENLCDRELNSPEGAGFDLRIKQLFKITSAGYLGEVEREASGTELIADYKKGETTTVVLQPGEHYLMNTIENVNTPDNIVIRFRPRITLFRSGVHIVTGSCAPGYSGNLFFALHNMGKFPFKLELGARVVHATFHKVEGSSNLYKGQWQGGRVTTDGKETQI
jgi:deoxycytidine triphosphate deaminase